METGAVFLIFFFWGEIIASKQNQDAGNMIRFQGIAFASRATCFALAGNCRCAGHLVVRVWDGPILPVGRIVA